MKWIVIEPLGGLGNRLRVIASAVIAAEEQKRKVLLIWKKSACCRCDYPDIFAPNPHFEVVSPRMTRLAERLHSTTGISSPALFLPLASRGGRSVSTIDTDKMAALRFRIQSDDLADCAVVYFKEIYWDFMLHGMSPSVYADKVKRILKTFLPAQEISRRLFDIPSPKVGVHIRHAADSVDAIRVSSMERFIAAMESCVQQQPGTKFFLATDTPAIEKDLRDRFPDKILSSPKISYGRDQTGIYDALVDLLMLSRCDRILGSYWSSFSEYAALIGGADMEVIGVGQYAGPGEAILTRARRFDQYGSEGWGQGWDPSR